MAQKELLRWPEDRRSSSSFMRCGLEWSSSWNWQRKCCLVLQMYIKYQPAGDDHRDTANSDSVLVAQMFFDGKRVYCQMLRSSAMKRPPVNQKGANNVSNFSGSVPVSKCYRGHISAMSGVCPQWCHEDSPVDSAVPTPTPAPLPFQIMTEQ